MSKASEWADSRKILPPRCKLAQSAYFFGVTEYGELGLYDSDPTGQEVISFKPEVALALRDWLTDTFDEKPVIPHTGDCP